jgi:ribulose-phosphate 3-epimerase
MSVRIAPSILSADFARLGEEVATVVGAGADWVHVDVMDGHFVPNITLGPAITAAVQGATAVPVDVHLMIEHPERFVNDFVEAGADYLTVHHEACPHLHRTIQQIRDAGARPGVAINPATPVSALSEIAGDIDLLLVMSVNPGFGGQAFIPGSIRKVREAREMLDRAGSRAVIEVDGGVDGGNAAELAEAGVDVLVAGSAIFRHPDGPARGVQALIDAIS